MKKVFQLTNKYIMLAVPLVLFSLVTSVYMAISLTGKAGNFLFAILLFVLMSAAFLSGWGNMIKNAVLSKEEENPNILFKDFAFGVGEYFLSNLGAIFVFLITFGLTMLFSSKIGLLTIGDPQISGKMLAEAFQNTAALKTFLASLTPEQIKQINLWNILLICSMSLYYFLTILYLPAIFFKNKNPFIALWISLKDLFSNNFFKTLGIYLMIFIINFIISILAALLNANMPGSFIMSLINFYFITLVCLGIMYYYNKYFVSYLGQNIDTEV